MWTPRHLLLSCCLLVTPCRCSNCEGFRFQLEGFAFTMGVFECRSKLDKYQSVKSDGIGFPAIPKLKETGDDAPIVQELGDYDPCLTAKNMCQNKGKCINRDGQFICQCPPTHFGKRCERLADTRFCKNHRCMNGGTCLSTERQQTFADPILLREYKKSHGGVSALQAKQNITITIQYQCICADGFIGEFCHLTEDERNCEEDYCSSHGRGHYNPDTGCTCECDPDEWIGVRCDIRSPCVDYSCMNSARCRLKYHPDEEAIEAICVCPTKTELIETKVEGDQCEKIETNEETSEYLPCQQSSNYTAWFKAMSAKLEGVDRTNLEMIQKSCVKIDGSNCTVDGVLDSGWCYREGKCNVRVEKFDSGKLYLVPFCECKAADSGRFCEYHRKDACDPTAIEKEEGVTRENRCTSILNGICIAPEGVALCDCYPGYVGEKCEIYDPCARNPCGKTSECIAIPDEVEVKGELSSQNYRCLCGMADSIDEDNTAETKCVYSGTGNCSRPNNPCNRGECLACDYSDQGEILQLCNDQEKRDGFRCVCEPSFMPPYCRTPEDACHNHLCMNGALCVAKSAFNYDCKCVPGTFGTLCEHVTDYCEAIGKRMCINGDCYEDPTTTRQFSCHCRFMFHGRNCELKYTVIEANMQWVAENSHFVIPAFSMMCTFILLFVVYFTCLNRRRRHEEKDDEQIHSASIRNRKLKVALEQKMNIVRKKENRHRMMTLMKKLRTPTKAERGTVATPTTPRHLTPRNEANADTVASTVSAAPAVAVDKAIPVIPV